MSEKVSCKLWTCLTVVAHHHSLAALCIVILLAGCNTPSSHSTLLTSGNLTQSGGFVESNSGYGIGVPEGVLAEPLSVEIHDASHGFSDSLPEFFRLASAVAQYRVSRTVSAGDDWFLLALPVDAVEDPELLSVAIHSPKMSSIHGEAESGWQIVPGTYYVEDQRVYALVRALSSDEAYISAALLVGGKQGTVIVEPPKLQTARNTGAHVSLEPLGVLNASVPIVVQSPDLTTSQRIALQDEIEELRLIERLVSAGFSKITITGAPIVRVRNPPVIETRSYNVEFTTDEGVCTILGRYRPISGTVSVCLSGVGPDFNAKSYLASELAGQTVAEILLHELFHAVQLGHTAWCFVGANVCADHPDDTGIATIEATARLSQRTLLAADTTDGLRRPFPPVRQEKAEEPFDVTGALFLRETQYAQQDFWKFVVERYLRNDFGNIRDIFEYGGPDTGMVPLTRDAIDAVLSAAGTSLGEAYWEFSQAQMFQSECTLVSSYVPQVQPINLDGPQSVTNPVGIPIPLTSGPGLTSLTTDFLELEVETVQATTASISVISSAGTLRSRIIDLSDCAVISSTGVASLDVPAGSTRRLLVVTANISNSSDASTVEILVEKSDLNFFGSVTLRTVESSFETDHLMSIENCPDDHLNTSYRESSTLHARSSSITVQFSGAWTKGGSTSISILDYSAAYDIADRSSSFEEHYQYNPVADETHHNSTTTWGDSSAVLGDTGTLWGGDSLNWSFSVPVKLTFNWGGSNSAGETWSDSYTIDAGVGVFVSIPIDILLSEGVYSVEEQEGPYREPKEERSEYSATCVEANRMEYRSSHTIATDGYSVYTLQLSTSE